MKSLGQRIAEARALGDKAPGFQERLARYKEQQERRAKEALFITADYNQETGVGEVAGEFNNSGFGKINRTDYGGGVRFCIILMCRSPHLKFYRRIRFNKKSKLFGIDVMLDYFQMRNADHDQRKRLIARALLDEIPAIIRKRKLPEFQSEAFISDFTAWFEPLK